MELLAGQWEHADRARVEPVRPLAAEPDPWPDQLRGDHDHA